MKMKAFLGLGRKRGHKPALKNNGIPILLATIFGVAALLGATLAAAARPAQKAANPAVPVQITVTEEPHHNAALPALQMNDLTVRQGHDTDTIDSLIPAQGSHAGLQLLVLIDDSDHWSLSDQFDQLRDFILEQPSTTAIGVGYMYNGLVEMAQPFTPDHQAAVAALHPPMGRAFGGSAYFSLMDMYKNKQWRPNSQYPRRAILLLTDGYDAYQRPYYTDTNLSEAAADMQAANIQVFTLCTPDSRGGGFAGGDLLIALSEATGGENLYAGLMGTPFFKPFLTDLNTMLQHQYLLNFEARGHEPKGGLESIKIKTNARDVSLLAPQAVYVPGD